jgi:hypothetical protein
MMNKTEMINRVNAWMSDYATGTADMTILEGMAETLIQSANMVGIDIDESLDYVDAYCDDFVPANLAAAMQVLKKEVEAA